MTGTDTTKCFADRLQDLIADSGKDVKTLAAEIGVSSGALSKYQNDKGEPGITALSKIAQYFGVTADYLTGLSDVKTTDENVKTVHAVTGLSEEAIKALEMLNCILEVSSYNPDDTCDLESVVPMNIVNRIIEDPSFVLAIIDFCKCIELTKQAEKVIITNPDLEDLRKRHHEVIEAGATIIRGSELADYLLKQAEERLSLCIRGFWVDTAFNSNSWRGGALNADNPEAR